MDYPRTIYASVLLLDNKIELWKVSGNEKRHPLDFSNPYWKRNRLEEYTIQTTSWEAKDASENHEVFQVKATEWFQQWEHAEDYKGWKAYGEDREF